MKSNSIILATAFFCHFSTAADGKDAISFMPHPGIHAKVFASKNRIEYTVATTNSNRQSQIPLEIEKPPKVRVEDFNFDGYKDFSIWYFDEGMGKYTVHRVFIFNKNLSTFAEAIPHCGEEFLNLKIDKIRRQLTSSYYVGNQPLSCVTRLPKSK